MSKCCNLIGRTNERSFRPPVPSGSPRAVSGRLARPAPPERSSARRSASPRVRFDPAAAALAADADPEETRLSQLVELLRNMLVVPLRGGGETMF